MSVGILPQHPQSSRSQGPQRHRVDFGRICATDHQSELPISVILWLRLPYGSVKWRQARARYSSEVYILEFQTLKADQFGKLHLFTGLQLSSLLLGELKYYALTAKEKASM